MSQSVQNFLQPGEPPHPIGSNHDNQNNQNNLGVVALVSATMVVLVLLVGEIRLSWLSWLENQMLMAMPKLILKMLNLKLAPELNRDPSFSPSTDCFSLRR